jgi:hypothetical protein
VRTHDGEPEQTPPSGPADFPTPQNAGGNWLVVDIGGGHFAFYANLQPHSITAKIEFIVLDGPRFRHSHASTVLPLVDGAILAAWFGGTHEGADDVAIWCARRNRGGTWTTPERIAAARTFC